MLFYQDVFTCVFLVTNVGCTHLWSSFYTQNDFVRKIMGIDMKCQQNSM